MLLSLLPFHDDCATLWVVVSAEEACRLQRAQVVPSGDTGLPLFFRTIVYPISTSGTLYVTALSVCAFHETRF